MEYWNHNYSDLEHHQLPGQKIKHSNPLIGLIIQHPNIDIIINPERFPAEVIYRHRISLKKVNFKEYVSHRYANHQTDHTPQASNGHYHRFRNDLGDLQSKSLLAGILKLYDRHLN